MNTAILSPGSPRLSLPGYHLSSEILFTKTALSTFTQKISSVCSFFLLSLLFFFFLLPYVLSIFCLYQNIPCTDLVYSRRIQCTPRNSLFHANPKDAPCKGNASWLRRVQEIAARVHKPACFFFYFALSLAKLWQVSTRDKTARVKKCGFACVSRT